MLPLLDIVLDEIKPGTLPFTAAEAGTGTENLISTIVGFLTIVSGLAFLIYLILGGFSWITSGGDPEKVKAAQNNITNAIVGLIVVVIAYAVVSIIGSVVGFSILKPAAMLDLLGPKTP